MDLWHYLMIKSQIRCNSRVHGGWQDGSVGKGTCCPEFNPWNPHDRKKALPWTMHSLQKGAKGSVVKHLHSPGFNFPHHPKSKLQQKHYKSRIWSRVWWRSKRINRKSKPALDILSLKTKHSSYPILKSKPKHNWKGGDGSSRFKQ